MLDGEFKSDFSEFAKRLGALRDYLPAVVQTALNVSLQEMQRDLLLNKMSGQYLGVRTGAARRSITRELTATEERVVGVIGSPLIYVQAHEEGFTGFVNIPGHVRRLIEPVLGRGGLLTKKSKKALKGAYQRGLSRFALVRPHKRLMVIRERRFIRASIWEGLPGLENRIQRAIALLLVRGAPPQPGDLAA